VLCGKDPAFSATLGNSLGNAKMRKEDRNIEIFGLFLTGISILISVVQIVLALI
jgi:hypothetical protein